MSIRARLALGSAAAVAVAIVLASAVVYFLVQKELRAQVDRNLETEATQIGQAPIPFAVLVYPPNIYALNTRPPLSGAYFHLAGGYDGGLHPIQLKRRSKSHWWLVDGEGRVIDLTLGPRESSSFPYHRGKRRPFRHTPAGVSRRAQTIVERVKSARG